MLSLFALFTSDGVFVVDIYSRTGDVNKTRMLHMGNVVTLSFEWSRTMLKSGLGPVSLSVSCLSYQHVCLIGCSSANWWHNGALRFCSGDKPSRQ